jgi:hypothetical protein
MRNPLGLLSLFVLLAVNVFGQTTSLNGTVTDPTGSVVPNVPIVIENVQTGVQRATTSDSQGRYTMPQLTPGTYKLTAKMPGFTDVEMGNLELLVNSPATVPIVFAKIGATSTTVTVEAAATQVNTTDASLGNVITSEAIIELPMYARNIVGLLASQPGVTIFGSPGQGANGTNNLDSRSGSVNGGKSDQANVTLDGADVNDQNGRTAFTTVLRVTPDSVEEFRSTTTNGDAATGRGSGADVALITKSGTNQLHGSLYEFRRGTETAANSFFNNRSGVKKPFLLTNLFGATVGGPIKKSKAFFFVNYEGRRDRSAAAVTRTVPSDLMRQGILQYHDAARVLQQVSPAQIKQLDPAGIGINAAGLALMNSAMPAGNDNSLGDGLNTTGYRFNSPVASDQNTYIAKLDYKLDSSGKHSLFWRGNLQNDSANGTPQFPGQPPNSVTLANNKGFASGWTGVLTPSLVNTFRYGFTRVGNQTTGVLTSNYEWFRGIDTPYGTSTGTTRIVPVHTIGDDLSWNHRAHDLRFGAIVRLVSNQSASLANSYSFSSSNPSWLTGSGNDLTGSLSITSGDLQSFQYGMGALLGIQAQGTGKYNYLVDGTVIPPGAPVVRNFVDHEGELYAQDTWKVTRNLTVTAGLRLSLAPPVYEANGQQASTNIPIADWLAARMNLADQGLSQNGVAPITFIAAGDSGGRPIYPSHQNWAPRVGIAYSPKADSGISKFLFGGPGKTSIRAGGGMYYDLIGQPLAQSFSNSQFGLSSSLSNPPNTLSTAQAPRFTTFFTVPSQLVPATPKGGLPVTYPSSGSGSFAITNSIDDKLKSPYTMNLDFSIGRDFGHGLFIQGAYVGRLSRHSLIQRDLAEATDLRDPASGQDYFSAIAQLATMLDLQGVTIANLPKIPFFERFWSTAATGGFTATQIWGLDYHGDPTRSIRANSNPGDFTNTLNNADNSANCGPSTVLTAGRVTKMACGVLGPWMQFNPQFSALSANSSIGKGSYHAMQWTIRKRFSGSLLFDLNYTWSKSIDLGSTTEGGTFQGFIINTFNPSQMRGVSSYDTTHSVNAHLVYQLPFGRGRKFRTGMNRILDAFVGGWEITGVYRQTSGLPFNATNGQRWPTNWNLGGNATPNGQPMPKVVSTGNATGIAGPNLWQDPAAAFAAYREDFAGESGGRTNLRGQGLFDIDSGVYKSFTMPWSEHQKLTFRWESYNLTNSVRFDPALASGNANSANTLSASSFGKLSSTLGNARQMQFALRFSW